MRKRWTLETATELFEKNNCTLLEDTYKNTATPMRYIATCGHEHHITLSNFLQGKGRLCRTCRIKDNATKESRGTDYFKSAFEEAGCTVLSDKIPTYRSVVDYIAQCGHRNKITAGRFLSGGGRVCAKCSKSVRYEIDYVRERFEEKDCVLLETEYKNCKTSMRYIASCGHESTISFDVFLNCKSATLRCKECHKHTYHDIPCDRNLTRMKAWRKAVYEKDRYTCIACGKHGGKINAHHLEAYDFDVENRFKVENGATLCESCHIRFHKKYGFGGNTKAQFNDWLQGIPR